MYFIPLSGSKKKYVKLQEKKSINIKGAIGRPENKTILEIYLKYFD